MQLAEVRPALIQGTMAAGGTLTTEIDIGGFEAFGLITDGNLVNSTLSFQVSAFPDGNANAFYTDLKDETGTAVTLGPTGTRIAVKSDILTQYLIGYRYVKIKSAATQTNGVKFYLPAKP